MDPRLIALCLILRVRHLLLEEYDPTLNYIKVPDNDKAGDLISITLINSEVTDSYITRDTLS